MAKDKQLTVQPAPTAITMPFRSADLTALGEDTPLISCPTSIDKSTEEGLALLLNMGGRGGLAVPQGGEVRLLLRHWLVMPDQRIDEETGEVFPFLRTVLSDGNGRIVASTSQHMPFRLRQLLTAYGPDRLRDGIPIAVRDLPSKRPGRHYHEIRLCKREEVEGQ